MPATTSSPSGVSALSSTQNELDQTDEPELDEGFFSRLRYIGQLQAAYLLCEADGELVVIDQHAAHERVKFEHIRQSFRARAVAAQTLLFPVVVDLSLPQTMVIQEKRATLVQLGFDFDVADGRAQLRSVPEGLDAAGSGSVFREILDELSSDETKNSDQPEAIREPLDHVMATMACHSVVRAGDRMGEAEVMALLRSMDGVDFRTHCPHGRPVLVRLSIAELEHRFGRT